MSRPLRVEYPGAIYHVICRGNARQQIFRDDDDYQRLVDGLALTVGRYGWELFSFVLMPNHFHLFFRTPQPSLSRGMQYLASGYANWFAKRHRRPGHLLQGRFKSQLVEDESYFWSVSRYVHLNSVRGKRPLVSHPRDWPWSSYPGYASRRARVDWVAYGFVYAAWQGDMGGHDPETAYRRYVERGLTDEPENPFRDATGGWLLGSSKFVDQIRARVRQTGQYDDDELPAALRLPAVDLVTIQSAVAAHYGVDPRTFRNRRSSSISRDVAAWLCRQLTTCTLRELAVIFGLGHADSVRNLTRRVDRALPDSRKLRQDIAAIRRELLETERI
jgi:putative transposase